MIKGGATERLESSCAFIRKLQRYWGETNFSGSMELRLEYPIIVCLGC